ncbi:MAG: Asp23/Gls24 family envelope stress response protein [Coriobacteriia bacterium]|nr:Asp23/Gls24 family envelope stress response protein [Coriobacteriia bacterium]
MTDIPTGAVQISNDVLADIAGYSALECYGIVGMASPTLRDGVAQLLSLDKLRRGVRVHSDGEDVQVDLYVVAEYGTNLSEVSHNMSERVRYVLQSNAEVRVAAVNVHVQGIKVRK